MLIINMLGKIKRKDLFGSGCAITASKLRNQIYDANTFIFSVVYMIVVLKEVFIIKMINIVLCVSAQRSFINHMTRDAKKADSSWELV